MIAYTRARILPPAFCLPGQSVLVMSISFIVRRIDEKVHKNEKKVHTTYISHLIVGKVRPIFAICCLVLFVFEYIYIYPAKILPPFLPKAPLQYVPKIRFTQATIDCLTANKTKNALHKETVILNHIGGDQLAMA